MENSDITIAKSLLGTDNIVFVIVKNNAVLFSSSKKGIQPFFDALEQLGRHTFHSCSIADRVVGKAALLMAAYLGAKSVYTPITSRYAIDAAKDITIDLIAEKEVPYIINRTKDGMCPLEKAVLNISDPFEAYKALQITLEKLTIK